ncbi:MAG TPA: urease accessory protein UreD [Burkholderiaceae bacterium]|nr:urease accessory protein UreD [Burkholderiaceae bacterium]HQR75742.1 urease accessory protein UreD [Burkholderiaceae bacterium]
MFDGREASWHATLALRFHRRDARTLCTNRHQGPLRMQKPLYPEGDAICHAVIIHPPGGIAGGDALEVTATVEPRAHALVTTPGAAKWYKANGRAASQRVRLRVSGSLEWLPQEAIVFDQADVRSAIDIHLDAGAAMIGWDIVALGRRAAGERFERGCYAQSIRLRVDDALVWHERSRILGGDPLQESPIGLDGHHVFGCLWAAGAPLEALDLNELRAELGAADASAPVTRLAPQLLVARTLAQSTSAARTALAAVWGALRPRLFGVHAQFPRLWAT